MACLFGHKWNGCKCSKCGKTRNELHSWSGCKCKICDEIRDDSHTWINKDNGLASCSVCGDTTVHLGFFSEKERQLLSAAVKAYSEKMVSGMPLGSSPLALTVSAFGENVASKAADVKYISNADFQSVLIAIRSVENQPSLVDVFCEADTKELCSSILSKSQDITKQSGSAIDALFADARKNR